MSVVQIWVGIDVSKRWFDVCVSAEGDRNERRFANDRCGFEALLAWLGTTSVHVCLEGTGGYERALCVFLVDAGALVSRANSLLVRRFAEGMGMLHKTDRLDAWILAEFCRLRRPPLVELEPRTRRELRQLVRTHLDLKKQRRQLRNQLVGPSLVCGAQAALEIAMLGICQAIAEAERRLDLLLDEDAQLAEEVRLLSTIPGVAKTAALKILAQLPEGLLRSPKALAAYAGLAPALKESGTTCKGSAIPIRCSRTLRAILFMAGLVARRNCPHLKAFALGLVARGKAKKQAIIAVARKLAHAIFAVLTRRQPYDGAKLCAGT
jgi:transposase